MDHRTEFDLALALDRGEGIKGYWRDAAIEVTDSLALAWVAAQTTFGAAATPEHALAIARMYVQRHDLLAREHARTAAERYLHTPTDPA